MALSSLHGRTCGVSRLGHTDAPSAKTSPRSSVQQRRIQDFRLAAEDFARGVAQGFAGDFAIGKETSHDVVQAALAVGDAIDLGGEIREQFDRARRGFLARAVGIKLVDVLAVLDEEREMDTTVDD